jgi:hypothetical protein
VKLTNLLYLFSRSGMVELYLHCVGCEVFTAVVMKSIIFWDMTPCSPLSCARRFGGTYRLRLQDRRNRFSKPASKQVASTPVPFATTPQYCSTALFRATYSGTCFLLVQGFKDGPMGTEFQSSTYPLFPYIYRPSNWLSILLATCLLAGLLNLFLRP